METSLGLGNGLCGRSGDNIVSPAKSLHDVVDSLGNTLLVVVYLELESSGGETGYQQFLS